MARFTEEEMEIDEGLGYPKAYARLCRDISLYPYNCGPPFTFVPYALSPQEELRARELDQMFPVVNPEAKPSARPKIYANLLWKQLNHLGNAGFDPAKFRVDPYGNVLYFHADSASPLAWEIDHWFPCSRGGRTVASNLRILQWKVCKKKDNQLEFLVPWWDLQLGVSVNQFLSVFASSNSDFRNRAFSLFFTDGENEELNSSQTAESHVFPQHLHETKEKVGLAPAAVVLNRRESSDVSSVLRSIDVNRRLRSNSPANALRKISAGESDPSSFKSIQTYRPMVSKENDNSSVETNPYLTIALARDSLRQREEIQAEIQKLDDELDELKQKNDKERVALQDLELVLIKRRRRAEKCRRLAEAQSSYRALIEKMIRDAMHQSVVYKEQVRLNQAATSALMARLEAQKAICDSSEKELHKKFKQREEVEQQIKSCCEYARKRSRIDDAQCEGENKLALYLPGIKPRRKTFQKQLRAYLEEEHKASQAGASLNQEREEEDDKEEQQMQLTNSVVKENAEEHNNLGIAVNEEAIEDKLEQLNISSIVDNSVFLQSPETEEDEECRKQRGKGNVEKWLQMLLEDTKEGISMSSPHQDTKDNEKTKADEIIEQMNLKNPQKDIRILKFPTSEEKADVIKEEASKELVPQVIRTGEEQKRKGKAVVEMEDDRKLPEKRNTSEVSRLGRGVGSKSFERKERREKNGKERELMRCESARTFRPAPYSPSVILGMKKGVDCIGKKPIVTGSDEDVNEEVHVPGKTFFFRSPFKTMKKAVKI